MLRLSQGISSGCHHATPTPYIFSGFVICVGKRVMVRLDPVFCFDLSRVFLQGATMPSLHPRFFIFYPAVVWEIEIARWKYASTQLGYVFRVPPCHPYNLENFFNFWICQQCCKSVFCFDLLGYFFPMPPCHPYTHKIDVLDWSLWERQILPGALYFCFDLARVFLQGAIMPPLHQKNVFLELSLWEGGIMLLLRLSQGISARCHHATPTPFSGFVIIVGRRQIQPGALCFCFDLSRVFLQDANMPPLHPIFFGSVINVGKR